MNTEQIRSIVRILCLYEKHQLGKEEWTEILELIKEGDGQADAHREMRLREIISTLGRFVQSRLPAEEILRLALCVSVYLSHQGLDAYFCMPSSPNRNEA